MLLGEDRRKRLSCGQKPEPGILRDLPVNHGDELVLTRRLVEPRVEVLEQPSRYLPEHVQFVDRPEEKGLMQHCGEERIGHTVSGDIEHGDPGHLLATVQVLNDLEPSFVGAVPDSCLQVKSLLEVHVDQVIAAHHTVPVRVSSEVYAVQSPSGEIWP